LGAFTAPSGGWVASPFGGFGGPASAEPARMRQIDAVAAIRERAETAVISLLCHL
jgi:hypothetical protein